MNERKTETNIKRTILRKQANALKHGVGLRGWGATESTGNASQMP